MASPEHPSLTILGGPMGGQRVVFDSTVDSVLIGSDSSCTFRVDVPGVSPIHASVRLEDGGLNVFDTQSPRGVYINDDRVETQAALRNGDILWLGKPGEPGVVMIQCRIPSRPAESAPPPTVAISPATVLDDDMVDANPDAVETTPVADTGADAFFSDSDLETQALPPTAAPRVREEDRLPSALHVDAPPRPAVPHDFEDETAADVEPEPEPELPPTVIAPPPTIAVPMPTPPPVAEPTVAMPPPVAPRPPAVPPARPSASPRPAPPTPHAPKAPAPRPKAAATPVRSARRGGGGSGAKGALIAGALLVLVIAAATGTYIVWRSRTTTVPQVATAAPATPAPATPAPMTAAPVVTTPDVGTSAPATSAPATTPIEEVVTVVKQPSSAPSARPRAVATAAVATATKPPARAGRAAPSISAPTAPPVAAQVATLRSQAEAAAGSGQFDTAIARYDDALRLSPQDEASTTGRARAVAARDALKRRFVGGRTVVLGGKSGKGEISGFESSDVTVTKAIDYSGRIEFDVQPEHVRPGVNYTIKVWLTNDGKKSWKIGSVTTTTAVNGNRTNGTIATDLKEIDSQQKSPLGEVTGAWPDGVTSWSLEVVVASSRGDSFKSTLNWR